MSALTSVYRKTKSSAFVLVSPSKSAKKNDMHSYTFRSMPYVSKHRSFGMTAIPCMSDMTEDLYATHGIPLSDDTIKFIIFNLLKLSKISQICIAKIPYILMEQARDDHLNNTITGNVRLVAVYVSFNKKGEVNIYPVYAPGPDVIFEFQTMSSYATVLFDRNCVTDVYKIPVPPPKPDSVIVKDIRPYYKQVDVEIKKSTKKNVSVETTEMTPEPEPELKVVSLPEKKPVVVPELDTKIELQKDGLVTEKDIHENFRYVRDGKTYFQITYESDPELFMSKAALELTMAEIDVLIDKGMVFSFLSDATDDLTFDSSSDSESSDSNSDADSDNPLEKGPTRNAAEVIENPDKDEDIVSDAVSRLRSFFTS